MSGIWASGTAGTGVNTSYTAAALETARAAGLLTAGRFYSPSDVTPRVVYWTYTTSALDPIGASMQYIDSTSLAAEVLTASISTPLEIDVTGYAKLVVQFKNNGANPINYFELATRVNSSASYVVTHLSEAATPTTQFTDLTDGILLGCWTDNATRDPGVLPAGATAILEINCRGMQAVRLRARIATLASTADVYTRKITGN